MARIHRDGEITSKTFEGVSGIRAKIKIYQNTLKWVLTKQRSENKNVGLTEFDTPALQRILREAGLCITQSGREWSSIEIIYERLSGDKEAKQLLEQAQKRIGENPLRNALAAFYLRPVKASGVIEGAVEFVHKSFGEFLCAKKFQPVDLFQRLQYFYFDWCRGKFINAYPKNLPLNQMQKYQSR